MYYFQTGTGSDVKAPKKPERPKPSHAVKHERNAHKHSSANQNEARSDRRHSSANIPAFKDGNISPSSKNSQGQPIIPTDSQRINQNGVKVEPNVSSQQPNTSSSPQHGDKDSALTSPQKHREKRKHCDSSDSDKHRHKKRKHSKDARFEGHRISHLVKKRTFKKEEGDDEAGDQKKSDDYVLAKLFRKSGTIFCF